MHDVEGPLNSQMASCMLRPCPFLTKEAEDRKSPLFASDHSWGCYSGFLLSLWATLWPLMTDISLCEGVTLMCECVFSLSP